MGEKQDVGAKDKVEKKEEFVEADGVDRRKRVDEKDELRGRPPAQADERSGRPKQ